MRETYEEIISLQ